jgi:hypothetical protein
LDKLIKPNILSITAATPSPPKKSQFGTGFIVRNESKKNTLSFELYCTMKDRANYESNESLIIYL